MFQGNGKVFSTQKHVPNVYLFLEAHYISNFDDDDKKNREIRSSGVAAGRRRCDVKTTGKKALSEAGLSKFVGSLLEVGTVRRLWCACVCGQRCQGPWQGVHAQVTSSGHPEAFPQTPKAQEEVPRGGAAALTSKAPTEAA